MRHALPRALPCLLPVVPAALLPAAGHTARHAAPRAPLTAPRTAVAVGLSAAVLPLGAVPAVADVPPAGSSGTGTGSSDTAAGADAPRTAAGTAATAPAAAAPPVARVAQTSVTLSAPSRDADGRVPVSVRLLADGAPVRDGLVRLERSAGAGWTYAGRLLTHADGTGSGTLALSGDSRLRATYPGAPVRAPSRSATQTVDVTALDRRSALRAGGGPGDAEGGPGDATAAGGALLEEAARHLGKPYRYGATGPSAFDCSGFTAYVYARFGTTLPHNSRAQERMANRVSRAQARPGDLVFIKDVRGHVGIYAGNGLMYDAPRAGKSVSLRRIWTPNHVIGRVG